MFRNSQVMQNMASSENGAIHLSDPFFSLQNDQNPNVSFMPHMPFSHVYWPSLVPKEEGGVPTPNRAIEEIESGSAGNEQIGELSSNEQELTVQQPRASARMKRYHRHTANQIEQLEALFKERPHPDDKQRMKLSQDLGLKPSQVKFWFQNRRTQLKALQDRTDNAALKRENNKLKTLNYRLQTALNNIQCSTCNGGLQDPETQQLLVENGKLREEYEKVCAIASTYNVEHSMQRPYKW